MKKTMMNEQVFCLRNWALYANSLRIRVTASYDSGLPDESAEIDLRNRKAELEDVVIIVEDKHPDRLFIGVHNKSVSSFTIELEHEGLSIRNLQLEYAMVSARAAADPQNDNWEYEQLFFDKLVFTREQDHFSVDMSIMAGKTAVPAETDCGTEKYECCREDLIGNIEADLDIAYFYKGTEGAALVRNLENLLESSANMTEGQLLAASLESEVRIMSLISLTQRDIRQYQDELLEDTSIGGKK